MSKEELLSKLKEMFEVLNDDKTNQLVEEDAKKELKEIQKGRQELIFDANMLKQKLSDDNNYLSFMYMRNNSRIFDLENKMKSLEQRQVENKTNILEITNRINYINGEIEACNSLLSDEQRSLDELGRQFRLLKENESPELEEQIKSRMEYHRSGINYLMNELNSYTQEKDELTASLEQYNSNTATIESMKQRYNNLLEELKQRANEPSGIDYVKKEKDERKLLQLEAIINSFNNREQYISFDLSSELLILIEDIEKDNITVEQALSTLQEIRHKIPEKIASKNSLTYEEEVKENEELQEKIKEEIRNLEDKLIDEQNYTPFSLAIEAAHDEVADLENQIVKYEINLSSLDETLLRFDGIKLDITNQIQNLNNEILNLEAKNDEIRLKMVLLSSQLSDEELKNLEKEKNSNKKKISNIRAKIERLQKLDVQTDLSISTTKKYKKDIENQKNKDLKELESKKKTLNDRVTIDKAALSRDKDRLANLQKQLIMLESYKKVLSYDYEEELDKLIETLSNSISEDAQLNNSEPNQDIIETEPAIEENDVLEETPLVEENDVLGEEPLVEEEPTLTEENLPVPAFNNEVDTMEEEIVISKWGKAKKKVLDKLKDKEFIRRAKAAIAALIVSLGVGYVTAKLTNNIESDVQIIETTDMNNKNTDADLELKEEIETPDLNDELVEEENIKKSNDEIALEVIRGVWGNGQERKNRLTAAGYDYYSIQSIVDNMLNQDNAQSENQPSNVEELVPEEDLIPPLLEQIHPEQTQEDEYELKVPGVVTNPMDRFVPAEDVETNTIKTSKRTVHKTYENNEEDIIFDEIIDSTSEEPIIYSTKEVDIPENAISFNTVSNDGKVEEVIRTDNWYDEEGPVVREASVFEDYLEKNNQEVNNVYDSDNVSSLTYQDDNSISLNYETDENETASLVEQLRKLYASQGLYDVDQLDDMILDNEEAAIEGRTK